MKLLKIPNVSQWENGELLPLPGVDLEQIESITKYTGKTGKPYIDITHFQSGKQYVQFPDFAARDKWFDIINKEINSKPGGPHMFQTITADLKTFIKEHKQIIYLVAILFLADHFLFQGAFRSRLHDLMNKLLGKVETAVDGAAPRLALANTVVTPNKEG